MTEPTIYHVRPATRDDLEACFELRRLAEQQLRHAGLDQWHDSEEGKRVITKWIDRGTMSVVTTHAGDIVACFALDGPDQQFWTAEESDDAATYLYKIIIRPDRKGSGLGEAILDYASDFAEQFGDEFVRVDCWQSNTGLHRYFTDRGFVHIDTRTAEGRNSGWLAQRHVSVRSNDPRVRLTEEQPIPVLGGDRYDDPVSRTWQEARDEIAAIDTHLDGEDIGATAALEQAVRALDVRAREQRQRNGMTHRPYSGQHA